MSQDSEAIYRVKIITTDVAYSMYMNSYQLKNTQAMLRSNPMGPNWKFTGYISNSHIRGSLMGKKSVTISKYRFVSFEEQIVQP